MRSIYFIEDRQTKNVKIGTTVNLRERLQKLQVGNPNKLYVALEVKSDTLSEKAIHRALADTHIRGEWFRPSDRLASLMLFLESWKVEEIIE